MSDVTAPPRPSRLRPLALRFAFAGVALVAWAFAAESAAPTSRVGLFLLAAGGVFGATGRRLWPTLTFIGVLAFLMHEPGVLAVDLWSLLFLTATGTGLAMWLRGWPGLRWVAASIPCWVYANESDWSMAAALTLSIGGIAIAAVGPTLPARRRRHAGAPLPHLASGPIEPVMAATYPAARRSRLLVVASGAAALLAVVLFALAAAGLGEPALTGGLGLASVIIAVTFQFSHWFSGRVRIRVDEVGIHGRVMFGEHTVRWTEVSFLSLRYVFMPGFSVRLVYYSIRSPSTEIAFPSSMPGASDLRATIERATGETWPEPEIDANF